jgi:hypothetical protein
VARTLPNQPTADRRCRSKRDGGQYGRTACRVVAVGRFGRASSLVAAVWLTWALIVSNSQATAQQFYEGSHGPAVTALDAPIPNQFREFPDAKPIWDEPDRLRHRGTSISELRAADLKRLPATDNATDSYAPARFASSPNSGHPMVWPDNRQPIRQRQAYAVQPASYQMKVTSDEADDDYGAAIIDGYALQEAPLPGPLPIGVAESQDARPSFLRERDSTPFSSVEPPIFEPDMLLEWPMDPPLGYTGRSGIRPREVQQDAHFVPVEDRWRVGFPEWDRYERGHPRVDDYPYVEGNILNPFTQNVLKGDYPIIGQHTFLNVTATSLAIAEFRQVPTATTPFESTRDPFQEEFFGDPNQFFYTHNFLVSFDLFHGDAGFKQPDWRIKFTPIFNLNYLDVNELAVVRPDVTEGTTRYRGDFALEEWFVEAKLADLSPDFDILSFRGGSQFFNSDFRGFIFSDTNRAMRLFGTRLANRDQFNLIFFDQTEKDTNSLLNSFDDRHQNTFIANYFRQDFIWPGYTAELSFHYNHDKASFKFDNNDFLVRPDPVGVFAQHRVDAYYLGWAGDGHINRININHALYWVLGYDTLNPLAGREQSINAQMGALELSYDRDWVRFRTSYFYSSGDDNIRDGQAKGFDAIFDNPNFAGGEFSYWQRQTVKLFGVNLVNRMSLIPDLRSSKFQGQTNFVNPGLHLINVGMDGDITPKLKLIGNVNFLWFEQTEVLKQFVFAKDIHNYIGTDLSLGIEYRPLHNNNIILISGLSGLIPGRGFKQLFDPLVGKTDNLFASFIEAVVTY